MTVKLLDCTLRDGGFVNDWKFGSRTIKNVVGKLADANVDFIEVGYLRDNAKSVSDSAQYPHTGALADALSEVNRKNSKLCAMVEFPGTSNLGTCSLENIGAQKESGIDYIRVMVNKNNNRSDVTQFFQEIRARGYGVCVQPVSVTSWSETDMLDLLKHLQPVDITQIAVVDTYGLLHWSEAEKYFRLLDDNLAPGVGLGFHAHNNFQMAYANSVMLTKFPTKRNIVIDASLYGMGKSAGNAHTELVAMYLNRTCGGNYGLVPIMEAIDSEIAELRPELPWGYSLQYYLAALHGCQPNYVEFLLGEIPLSAIDEILGSMDPSKKLTFCKEYIQGLVNDHFAPLKVVKKAA